MPEFTGVGPESETLPPAPPVHARRAEGGVAGGGVIQSSRQTVYRRRARPVLGPGGGLGSGLPGEPPPAAGRSQWTWMFPPATFCCAVCSPIQSLLNRRAPPFQSVIPSQSPAAGVPPSVICSRSDRPVYSTR